VYDDDERANLRIALKYGNWMSRRRKLSFQYLDMITLQKRERVRVKQILNGVETVVKSNPCFCRAQKI